MIIDSSSTHHRSIHHRAVAIINQLVRDDGAQALATVKGVYGVGGGLDTLEAVRDEAVDGQLAAHHAVHEQRHLVAALIGLDWIGLDWIGFIIQSLVKRFGQNALRTVVVAGFEFREATLNH